MGATEKVFGIQLHPNTRMLIASVPQIHRRWEHVEVELGAREAVVPHTCPFHERITDAVGRNGSEPTPVEAEDDHFVACFELDGADGSCRPSALAG